MPLPPLNVPRTPVCRLLGIVRAVPLTVFGFVTLIGFNFLQMLSLTLIPFSRKAFRRFNRWCADTWWGWCVIGGERINRTRIVITGEEVPPRENAIVVVNHQQMPDITTVMAFARSKGRLGDLKFFVKKALQIVPGLGWGMSFLDCLFVRRDWAADRSMITKTFRRIVNENVPLWLVSFVEGTRITPAKLARSQEFAKQRGIEIMHHVLTPRTKGFSASVVGLGDHIAAVYDLTIGYVEGVPTLWQYIKGHVRRIHLHVRRFPVEELPRLEHELNEWLLARFAEKDRLLAYYYQHGAFPEEPIPAELTP
jgi:1-acyl-sn-glycerol-3-phosphate acyltransferase